ncbi:hypothetical protein SSYRP_v1c08300 [Spiroplasma syrphidicola EA-1]|uniref:Uncharacterized protein n=1 Tax=Spiroplasma syrphidicola EA-1 TaxID=1276229 RepID=R4UER7_9MOLU|nr:hypothetical protein [Spiroplasma syrphidicola]AGM26419.1 hypothetical protein SSYRP_v1c08300 [Spiroplasma syrphidicola EA-1]
MAINLLKTILASTILTTTPVGVSASVINENSEVTSPREALFQTIKSSSTVKSTKTKYSYDNHVFYSQTDLDNYIYQSSKIETIQTSSNPGKIIEDYQYRTLKADKIYDTDFNNFQLVYRDAYGNTALTKQAALNTYTNAGSVKAQYSYDGIGWFDSPEEAKNGFIYKGGLHKSLYYYVNGRYYNVFNEDDQAKLLNSLTSGYYVKPSEFTQGLTLYGTKETLKDTIHNNFESTWTDSSTSFPINYTSYLETDVNHKIYLSPGGDDMIKVSINRGRTQDYYRGDTFVFEDKHNQLSKDELTTKMGWQQKFEKSGPAVGKYYWTKTINLEGNQYDFTYLPIKAGSFGKYTDFNWNALTSSQDYNATLYLYDKVKNDPTRQQIYRWDNIGIEITNPNEIPTTYVRQSYDIWFNNFYSRQFLTLDKKDENGIAYNDFGVYADTLYDVNGTHGDKYSVRESVNYYNTVLKQEILQRETIIENGVTKYKLREDFYASAAELNQYLFLTGDMNTVLMYTYLDVENISSIDGLALAPTQAQAQERLFQLESGVLLKQYFAYDAFGSFEISGESAEDAIKQLQNRISLTGRYVNKAEIESWNGHPMSFDNIIEDGVYNVYRIFSSIRQEQGLDPYIYFESYSAALIAIKAGINEQIQILTETINVYIYVYKDKNNETHTYSYTNDNEIEQIINEIMSLA